MLIKHLWQVSLYSFALILFTGCTDSSSPTAATPNTQPASDQAKSHDRVCRFAEQLLALEKLEAPETATLRYLNEQWRELNLNRSVFPLHEATTSRGILSELNLALAHETVTLLKESMKSVSEAYEKIEGLRRFSRDPENMKVPDSIIRTMVNNLENCCLSAINGNATSLVRETKGSPMYKVGELGYFINRDVNAILRNELALSEYTKRLENAADALPEFVPVSMNITWAQCD